MHCWHQHRPRPNVYDRISLGKSKHVPAAFGQGRSTSSQQQVDQPLHRHLSYKTPVCTLRRSPAPKQDWLAVHTKTNPHVSSSTHKIHGLTVYILAYLHAIQSLPIWTLRTHRHTQTQTQTHIHARAHPYRTPHTKYTTNSHTQSHKHTYCAVYSRWMCSRQMTCLKQLHTHARMPERKCKHAHK